MGFRSGKSGRVLYLSIPRSLHEEVARQNMTKLQAPDKGHAENMSLNAFSRRTSDGLPDRKR
jgi:hypothetical protein